MLYNKHRPKTFEDFHARDTTISSIKSLLKRKDQKPQVFLFHGPKGTGKTTISYLIANHIGCDNRSISRINFSVNTGVDTSRALEEEAWISPRYGNVKAYICDEIQRLSGPGQQSLLDLLEHPPKHCYFFLCTTDPTKIIEPLQDRCYLYELKKYKSSELFEIMSKVCKKENKKIPDKIIRRIANNSNGSARSALINLDKIIDIPQNELDITSIEFEQEDLALNKLGQALLKKTNWKNLSEMLSNLNTDSEDVRRFIDRYMTSCLLNGNKQAAVILEAFEERKNIILACFDSVT